MTKSKRKQQKQTKQQSLLVLGAVAVLALIIGAFLALSSSDGSAAAAGTSVSQVISPAQYQSQFSGAVPHLLLDVRTPEEFNSGHIPGAVNISVETLASRLGEVPSDVPVVVYCRSGNRSAQAANILASGGYSQIYDLGGIINWTAAGLPVE